MPGREGEAGITVHYDGQGRHVWERIVSEGLREHVVCDGSTLWHVYREIGLASKRPYSRFHHQDLTTIVPWLLPSADELARGADLTLIDDRTVAVVPTSESSLVLHLVFGDAGQLAERRYIDTGTNKVLHRLVFEADGTLRLLDADGKELAVTTLHRAISSAPQLVPDLSGLVMLPMPVRTPEVIIARTNTKDGTPIADAELSEDDALSLMLAYLVNGNGARMIEIARQRFIDRGDTRDGLYVLLSHFPNALVQDATPADATPGSVATAELDLRPSVEGSPLRQFLRQYITWLRDISPRQPGSTGITDFQIDAPVDSFLQRLATARNLFVRWQTDAATKDRTKAQVQQEVQRTIEFIAKCRTLEMGWTLMSAMRPRLTTPELLTAYSAAATPFEQHPQIGLLVRRERMTALFAALEYDDGFKLFTEWLNIHLRQGVVPPIGEELYRACVVTDGQTALDELLMANARRLVDVRMLMTAHSLSVQLRELGNTRVADQIMTLLLTSLDAKQRPDVTLQAIEHLRRLKDPRADMLLEQIMELPAAHQVPGLWRFASTLAEESGRKRLAAERLERAMQLEFARLLLNSGQAANARKLLEQIISGTWQPRFSGSVEQARSELNSIAH